MTDIRRHIRDRLGWTEEREQQLRNLRANGVSAMLIGIELGLSRNAVLGKANRLKARLPMPGEPLRARIKPGPKPMPKPQLPRSHDAASRAKYRRLDIAKAKSFVKDDSFIPIEQRCTITDLTMNTCRWPVGDPGKPGFFFCGGNVVEGLPYCHGHCKRAFAPKIVKPGFIRNGYSRYGVMQATVNVRLMEPEA
jgi:GcrA cell cycle regulator